MPRRIALIIGISRYQRQTKLTPLQAPVHDAQAVYEILAEYGDFDTLHPLPLADGKVGESGSVSVAELQEVLQQVFSPHSDDEIELVALYFSGHGVFDSRGQVVYLSASDEAQAIALSWLADLAKNSAAQNVCLWLDCCHSGELLKFSDLGDKGFCVVAASHAEGEALAKEGRSLLTEILCQALKPDTEQRREIRVLDFVQAIEAGRKNLPQQVLCRYSDDAFTLTQWQGEISSTSLYPADYPPYRGLRAFTKADQDFFFGREGMIQQLLNRLDDQRFVPVLGASGSGKSSLVLAGLLPRLPKERWQSVIMRPTAKPLQSLRDSFVRTFADSAISELNTADSLHRESHRLTAADQGLLLVIDQFEEVFTACHDETERGAFFACLLGALALDNPLRVVITLRTDFLDKCTAQHYSGLGQHLQRDQALLLVALDAPALRDAISKPLARVGWRCEQALEDELVNQTLQEQGSLPLLQYVLDKLWQQARQASTRVLTLPLYQALGGQHGGGLRGVLNEKADAFYQQLDTEQQRLMEWLLVELSQVGDSHQSDMRRTVTLQELHNRQPNHSVALDALLDKLVTQERLLTQDKDEDGQATVTVAHEALLRDWEKLRTWLTRDREIKQWRERQADNIAAWKTGVSGSLLREKRLAEAQQLLEDYPDSLLIGADERGFIAASTQAEKRRKQALWGAVATFMVVLVVGILGTWWQAQEAEKQRVVAEEQKKLAEQQEQEAEEQRKLAVLSAQEAEKQQKLAEQRRKEAEEQQRLAEQRREEAEAQRKQAELQREEAEQRTLEANYNLAKVYEEKINKLWNQVEHKNHLRQIILYMLEIQALEVSKEKVSPHTSILENLIKVLKNNTCDWLSHERMIVPMSTPSKAITTLALSPDKKVLASSSSNDDIQLWDMQTGLSLNTLKNEESTAKIKSMAFSPNNHYLVSGKNNGVISIWNTKENNLISISNEHTASVTSIVFDSSGKYFASGSHDNTIRVWDVTSGKPLNTLKGHTKAINSIAFSFNGEILASASGGNDDGSLLNSTVILWSLKKDSEPVTIQKNASPITTLAFSPDNEKLAGASFYDDEVIIWDIKTRKISNILENDTKKPLYYDISYYDISQMSFFYSLSFTNKGRNLVRASWTGDLKYWDIKSGEIVKKISYPFGKVNDLKFSTDNQLIISAHNNKIIARDLKNKKNILFQSQPLNSNTYQNLPCKEKESYHSIKYPKEVDSIAFDSNGKLLAVSYHREIEIIDLERNKKIKSLPAYRIGNNGEINSVASSPIFFSPTDELIIYGSYDGSIITLSLSNEKEANLLEGKYTDMAISSIAFSPNGKLIVSAPTKKHRGSNDYDLKTWSAQSYKEVDSFKNYGWVETNSIDFSEDGKLLAGAGQDGIIRLWNVKSRESIFKLQAHQSNSITSVKFSPSGNLLASTTDSGTIELWSLKTRKKISTLQENTSAINSISFSPDGKLLATAPGDKYSKEKAENSIVRLWDVKREEIFRSLHGHSMSVNSVKFSPDGKLLVSASNDKTVKFWDLDAPLYLLFYDFSPVVVADALKFLWNLELDGLEFIPNYPTPALLPQEGGHHITWDEHTKKFRSLLDAPRPNETKLDQLVRWLEERCAYKREEDKQACEAEKSAQR